MHLLDLLNTHYDIETIADHKLLIFLTWTEIPDTLKVQGSGQWSIWFAQTLWIPASGCVSILPILLTGLSLSCHIQYLSLYSGHPCKLSACSLLKELQKK